MSQARAHCRVRVSCGAFPPTQTRRVASITPNRREKGGAARRSGLTGMSHTTEERPCGAARIPAAAAFGRAHCSQQARKSPLLKTRCHKVRLEKTGRFDALVGCDEHVASSRDVEGVLGLGVQPAVVAAVMSGCRMVRGVTWVTAMSCWPECQQKPLKYDHRLCVEVIL
jgi:hypothetical protein